MLRGGSQDVKNHTLKGLLGHGGDKIPREATPREEVTESCQWLLLPAAGETDSSILKQAGEKGAAGAHQSIRYNTQQYRPGLVSALRERPNYFEAT